MILAYAKPQVRKIYFHAKIALTAKNKNVYFLLEYKIPM